MYHGGMTCYHILGHRAYKDETQQFYRGKKDVSIKELAEMLERSNTGKVQLLEGRRRGPGLLAFSQVPSQGQPRGACGWCAVTVVGQKPHPVACLCTWRETWKGSHLPNLKEGFKKTFLLYGRSLCCLETTRVSSQRETRAPTQSVNAQHARQKDTPQSAERDRHRPHFRLSFTVQP